MQLIAVLTVIRDVHHQADHHQVQAAEVIVHHQAHRHHLQVSLLQAVHHQAQAVEVVPAPRHHQVDHPVVLVGVILLT